MVYMAPPDHVVVNLFGNDDIYVEIHYYPEVEFGILANAPNVPPDRYPKDSNTRGEIYTGRVELDGKILTKDSDSSWHYAASRHLVIPLEDDRRFEPLTGLSTMYIDQDMHYKLMAFNPDNRKPNYENQLFDMLIVNYHEKYEKYIKNTYDKLLNIHNHTQITWDK